MLLGHAVIRVLRAERLPLDAQTIALRMAIAIKTERPPLLPWPALVGGQRSIDRMIELVARDLSREMANAR